MMGFQGGNGKSTFSQHSVYFPFGQEPTGVQELRSNLLTHVEESFWGERFSERNCTLHEPFYKADFGEMKGKEGIAARANACGKNRNRSKSKLCFFIKV